MNSTTNHAAQIKQFLSYCGGLPAPECASNPLGYKFSWSSRGVLLALLNSAAYTSSHQTLTIPAGGRALMAAAQPYFISPAYAFVGYPNRDSTPYGVWYGIEGAETVVRGTLRYQGFCEFVRALVDMGWLDEGEKAWLVEKKAWVWREVVKVVVGAEDASEGALIARINTICRFPSAGEASRIVSGLRWIGMFSDEVVEVRGGNLLDTLCARLERLMRYEEGERDLVMLQHKFVVEWADGSEVCAPPSHLKI